MDLLGKSVVVAIVIVLVLFALYYLLSSSFTQRISQQQATTLVVHDLQNAYPNAVVNVTNITSSQYSGSWHIITGVVVNATSPCPSYYIYSFDYPKFGFVYRVDNVYTNNCIVYGLASNKSYIIASYPVAIARATSLNTPAVSNFISKYGYSNVTVYAKYYNSTTFNNYNYTKIWIVNYSAAKASYSVYALLTQSNGNLITTKNVTH